MSATISFVIPHKGREAMLIDTLNSIASLDYPKSEISVVLVSQNPEVSDRVKQFASRMHLQVIINHSDQSISHSRNTGAKATNSDYIAFIDADIELDPQWANAMLSAIESAPDIALCAGTQVLPPHFTSLEAIRTHLASATSGTHISAAPGANLFLARTTFDKVGGFPETLRTCEDIYFTSEAARYGLICHVSEARFVHLGEDKAYRPMFKKEMWRGQSNLASLAGRSIPLREWPSFIIPFAVTGGIIAALISILCAMPYLSVAFAVVGLAPLLAYTVRLKRLVGKDVSLFACCAFYLFYFPARAIGTLAGLRGAVTTSTHK